MNIFNLSNWSWIKLTKWEKGFFAVACTCATILLMSKATSEFICLDGLIRNQSGVTKIGRMVGITFVLCLVTWITCLCARMFNAIWRKFLTWQKSLQWKGEHAKKKILDLSITAKKNVRAKFEHDKKICLSETSSEFAELLNGNFICPAVKANRLGVIECELKPWVTDCLNKYPNLPKELPEFEDWEVF